MTLYDGPVVDSHIHLFDTRRPQGIPWPEPGDVRFHPSLPEHYGPLAASHRIQRAIVIEASPWYDDNLWLSRIIQGARTGLINNGVEMAGFVGNLDLRDMSPCQRLGELLQLPHFLGIRYGNLWGRDPLNDLQRPHCVAALRTLAAGGYAFDSANPDPKLIKALLHATDAVPDLTVIVDHLPNANVPEKERTSYEHDLLELADRPTVFAKLSEIPKQVDGKTNLDVTGYQTRFDDLFDCFGEDRVMFGSDWPNSNALASFDNTVTLTKQLMLQRTREACRKFFADNAERAYKLTSRKTEPR